tara:strand:+ start:111 stop:1832 length:1722 start_codon:yes stop_codon:yes gene_type:complete
VTLSSRFQLSYRLFRRRIATAWRLLGSGNFLDFLRHTFNFVRNHLKRRKKVSYKKWRKKFVELTDEDRCLIAEQSKRITSGPSFALIVECDDNSVKFIGDTLESLVGQHFKEWTSLVKYNGTNNGRLETILDSFNDERISLYKSDTEIQGSWVGLISAGDLLHEAALFAIAKTVILKEETEVVYTDNDHFDSKKGFIDPYMKPDWNSDFFAGTNYLGLLTFFSITVWKENFSKIGDDHRTLVAAMNEIDSRRIVHLPHVLASKRVSNGKHHLQPAIIDVNHPLPLNLPRVSVLVPTRDKGKLLKRCLESVLKITDYPNFEVVIIDHESSEPLARETIDELKRKDNFVITSFKGEFNFSAMINQGVQLASGEVFVLLNNDTEVLQDFWLKSLVSQVCRKDVGVAGAVLLFLNDTIQHAGIHPNVNGLMGHGHKHWSADSYGYFGRLRIPHQVAAVTGACLAVEKSVWDMVGGLDEGELAVAYNDVDLCFKVRDAGLKVILDPRIRLLHHESASRGFDDNPKGKARLSREQEVMLSRWKDKMFLDPAYNPNLSFENESFSLLVSTNVSRVANYLK